MSDARQDNLDRAFDRVQETFKVSGAQKVAAKCIADLEDVIRLYEKSLFATEVRTRLTQSISAVRSAARPFDGADPDAALTPSWNGLRAAVRSAYTNAWSIQDHFPTQGTGGAVLDALTDPVGLSKAAGRFVGDVAGGVGEAAGGLAGGAVWEVVKSLWPVLVIAGLVAGGAIALSYRKA